MKYQKFIILFIILFIGILLRLIYFNETVFSNDEASWFIISQLINEGHILYKEIWTHRFPGIFAINLFIFRLFGENIFYMHLFSLFWFLLTILMIYKLSSYLYNEKIGYLSAFLYMFFSNYIKSVSALPVFFFLLPIIVSTYFLIKAVNKNFSFFFFLAGFFSGIAFLIKIPAIFNFILLFVYLLIVYCIERKKIKKIILPYILIIIGFTIGLFPFIYYALKKNIIKDFIFSNIIINFYYAGAINPSLFILKLIKGASEVILKGNFLIWILAFISLIYIFTKLIKKNEKYIKKKRRDLLLLIWLFFSFLGVCLGTHFFPHYFLQLFPPVAILGAATLSRIINKKFILESLKKFNNFFIIIILFFSFLTPLYLNQGQYFLKHYTFQGFKKPITNEQLIANYIKQNTIPNDYFYIWGYSPTTYFYTQRKISSIFDIHNEYVVGFSHSGKLYEIVPGTRNLLIKDLNKFPPKYFIDMSTSEYWEMFPLKDFKKLDDFVKKNYILETKIKDISVYRYKK